MVGRLLKLDLNRGDLHDSCPRTALSFVKGSVLCVTVGKGCVHQPRITTSRGIHVSSHHAVVLKDKLSILKHLRVY